MIDRSIDRAISRSIGRAIDRAIDRVIDRAIIAFAFEIVGMTIPKAKLGEAERVGIRVANCSCCFRT